MKEPEDGLPQQTEDSIPSKLDENHDMSLKGK